MDDDPAAGITRNPPGPVGRWFARAPRYLYRAGVGWVLGRRFVMVEHTGRKTGQRRETVVEVIRRDDTSLDVAAAWGTRSDWYRNIMADPKVRLSTGRRRRYEAAGLELSPPEAAEVFAHYSREHPRAARALAKTLGLPLDDPDAMAGIVPVIRFRPR